MEHGLLHASHSSCWCCSCGTALWWLCTKQKLAVPINWRKCKDRSDIYIRMKMKRCLHVRVLPDTQQPSASMRHTWTDPYTRIHHDRTRIALVYTRIVLVSVAVRPRKAWNDCCYRVATQKTKQQKGKTCFYSQLTFFNRIKHGTRANDILCKTEY